MIIWPAAVAFASMRAMALAASVACSMMARTSVTRIAAWPAKWRNAFMCCFCHLRQHGAMRHRALAQRSFIVYRRFTMNMGMINVGSEDDQLAGVMSALGHPARLAILNRLACCDACCCKEVVQHLDLAQSTVSQHLKVLVQAGLVSYEPRRPQSRYVLNRDAMLALSRSVAGLVEACCGSSSCNDNDS